MWLPQKAHKITEGVTSVTSVVAMVLICNYFKVASFSNSDITDEINIIYAVPDAFILIFAWHLK